MLHKCYRTIRWITRITLLLVAITTIRSSGEFCLKKDTCGSVDLDFVLGSSAAVLDTDDPNKLFFIETSGRDHLTTRQACAVESLAQNGRVNAVVLLASDKLNLNANNATFQLYHSFKGIKVVENKKREMELEKDKHNIV